MKAWVVYDSEFGNTAKVAEAIANGLGCEARHVKDVQPGTLAELDLLVVGAPTQRMDTTNDMHTFLDGIPDGSLAGVNIAAFDTRISIPDIESAGARFAMRVFLHRYAARPITNALKGKGGQPIIEPEGFLLTDTEGPLKEGELERAAAWGRQIKATTA